MRVGRDSWELSGRFRKEERCQGGAADLFQSILMIYFWGLKLKVRAGETSVCSTITSPSSSAFCPFGGI